MNRLFRRSALFSIAAAVSLAWAPPSDARVTRIVVDRTQALAGQVAGETPYETITGRAFGELDPGDQHNANGKVEYVASFFIVKPVTLSNSSGLMWHDVPNRGGRITISSDLRRQGDIGLSSAWQGDNAWSGIVPPPPQEPNFATLVPPYANELLPHPAVASNEWVKVPVLSGVTGDILGRIINRAGSGAHPLNV